jgi:hypothetical protein
MGGLPRPPAWWKSPRRVGALCARLARLPGVVGVYWGSPRRQGAWHQTGSICIHVREKRDPGALAAAERIPASIDGFATDIIEVGTPRAHQLDHTDTVHASLGRTGTVTALARRQSGAYALLSGHVALPDEPHGAGRRILRRYRAQGRAYGIGVGDRSAGAYLGRLVAGEFGGHTSWDWALAHFTYIGEHDVDTNHLAATLTDGDARVRYRRTALTPGERLLHYSARPGRRRLINGWFRHIAATPAHFLIGDDSLEHYTRLFVIDTQGQERFSEDGDSGSLVVDSQGQAVGTVLGASADYTLSYVLPIWPLLRRLGHRSIWFFK